MKNGLSWIHLVLVALLLLSATGVRLYHLRDESLWLDENITWKNLESPHFQEYLSDLRTRDTTFVPAYYASLYYWGKITEHDVFAARLLSVAFSLITALLVYLVARSAFGPTAGIAALAMTAFSNTHVYYGQEIRVYALYCMALMLSVWSLEKALRHSSPRIWALHQIANILLVFSHYFGALFLLTEGLYLLLFHRRPARRILAWFAAQGGVALLLVFWMLGIRRDVLEVTTNFLRAPRAETIEYAFTWAALYWPRSIYYLSFLSHIFIDMVVLLCTYCFWTRKQSEQSRERWQKTVLYLLMMILPLTAAIASCYLLRPALTLRYVLPASLMFFILIGGAISSLPRRFLRWGAASALICLMIAHQVEANRPYRPDLRKAGAVLSQIQTPDEALILASVINIYSREMYIHVPEKQIYECFSKDDLPKLTASLLQHRNIVWVLYEYGYSRGFSSLKELENTLRETGGKVERINLSSEHYTFLLNANWPELSNTAQGLVLYRISPPPENAPQPGA